MAYETFDFDLRHGQAREDAFVHVLLRSRVEHKRDKKAMRTGRVAVEIEQVCSDGIRRPSGVWATTAEYWAIEYAAECWLILPTEYVKRLVNVGINEKLDEWIGDGKNHRNVLIPITWFTSREWLGISV